MITLLSYTYENLEKTVVGLYIILVVLVIVYAWTIINAKFCKSTDKATISHLDMLKNNQDEITSLENRVKSYEIVEVKQKARIDAAEKYIASLEKKSAEQKNKIDELTDKVKELETDSEFQTSYIEEMEKAKAKKNERLKQLDERLKEIESMKVTIDFLENRIKTKDKVIECQAKELETVSKKFSNLLCALTQPDTNYVMREYHGIKIFNGSDKQDVGEIGDSWCSMTEETNGGVIVERQVVYGEYSANIVVKKFESGDIEFDKVNAMFLVEKLNEEF